MAVVVIRNDGKPRRSHNIGILLLWLCRLSRYGQLALYGQLPDTYFYVSNALVCDRGFRQTPFGE